MAGLKNLYDRIAQIPGGDGWWTSSGEETFRELGRKLLDAGLSEDYIVELLTEAYLAVSEEYGN